MHRKGTCRKTVNLAIKCFTINIAHKKKRRGEPLYTQATGIF
jgi:hypothetical protein